MAINILTPLGSDRQNFLRLLVQTTRHKSFKDLQNTNPRDKPPLCKTFKIARGGLNVYIHQPNNRMNMDNNNENNNNMNEAKVKTHKITHEGVINLNTIELPCYVLEDGRRVLSGRGLQESLKMVDKVEDEENPEGFKLTSGSRLQRHFSQNKLRPFISKHLGGNLEDFEPIVCRIGDKVVHGYEADVLVNICNAFLEARRHIKLGTRQTIIAEQCEILVSAFAKLGVIALIDEATGYQQDRSKQELQTILEKYVSEDLRTWTKTFPDIFYEEIYRLKGWDYEKLGVHNKPGVIGTWTNTLIYEQLPPGVLEELKRKTPKTKSGYLSSKLHQHLSENVGYVQLQKQLTTVIALLMVSSDWEDFMCKFFKLVEKREQQLKGN